MADFDFTNFLITKDVDDYSKAIHEAQVKKERLAAEERSVKSTIGRAEILADMRQEEIRQKKVVSEAKKSSISFGLCTPKEVMGSINACDYVNIPGNWKSKPIVQFGSSNISFGEHSKRDFLTTQQLSNKEAENYRDFPEIIKKSSESTAIKWENDTIDRTFQITSTELGDFEMPEMEVHSKKPQEKDNVFHASFIPGNRYATEYTDNMLQLL